MPPTITVVIRDDPRTSHRPVEGLRIALGLSTGSNPLTVILLDEAIRLLAPEDERDEIVDDDILEKHLPALKELGLPFVVREGATSPASVDEGFPVREVPPAHIASLISESDRVLVF